MKIVLILLLGMTGCCSTCEEHFRPMIDNWTWLGGDGEYETYDR